jgi:hypothetical protein
LYLSVGHKGEEALFMLQRSSSTIASPARLADLESPNASGAATPDITDLRKTIESHFPDLWPAVSVGLATCATLLLGENANPTALIYVGGPSTGKTTVASMFEGATITVRGTPQELCYRTDKFTPAAFVSQAANRTSAQLRNVDLLPRIKDKVLLTPELAPIFRGKDDELTTTFSIITRVLDGQGLQTDSGTHGQRGYAGPHLFAWIGCTTPFEPRVWKIMSQLGSRLFFLVMQAGGKVTVERLMALGNGPSYQERLAACRAAVHVFLKGLFSAHGEVRSVRWPNEGDESEARLWLARCAMLLAAMRTVPAEERELGGKTVYKAGCAEGPERALAVLTNLARGYALVHGRCRVAMDDLPLIIAVTVSSIPGDASPIFKAAVEKGGGLSVEDVRVLLGAEHPETARMRMRYLHAVGVLEFVTRGTGKPGSLRFRPGWDWCASQEFRRLLLGPPEGVTEPEPCEPPEAVSPEGVCTKLTTPNLAEHQKRGRRREKRTVHTGPEK